MTPVASATPGASRQASTSSKEVQPCLGLYISPEVMILSEAAIDRSGRPTISQLVKIPIQMKEDTAARGGTLNTDFLSDVGKLADLLKPVLAAASLSTRRIVVTLSSNFGLVRYFLMPAVDRRYWKQSIPLEAKKYIPFPFGDLKYDFQVFSVPAVEGKPQRMGVLFGVAPQKNIEGVQGLARVLELDLLAVELSAYSVGRVWQTLPDGHGEGTAVAQIHFDEHAAHLILHENGVPMISREVRWVGDQLDRRRLDLEGSIEFAKKQLGVPDVRIILTGSVDLDPFSRGIQEDTNLQVDQKDLAREAALPSAEWAALASVGAALRVNMPRSMLVDVSQTYSKLSEDMRLMRALKVLTFLLTGIILVMTFMTEAKLIAVSAKLAALRRKSSKAAVFSGMDGSQIENLMKKSRDSAAAYDDILGSRQYVTSILVSLANNLPSTMWFRSVTMVYQLGGLPNQTLEVRGYSYGTDRNADVAAVNLYKDALKKDKKFSTQFPDCDVAFPSDSGSGGGGGIGPTEAERRTPFSLDCLKKQIRGKT